MTVPRGSGGTVAADNEEGPPCRFSPGTRIGRVGKPTPAAWPLSATLAGEPTAGDEHVFPAVVRERLAGKAGVQRLHLETGDVEEPSHSFLVAHHRELL